MKIYTRTGDDGSTSLFSGGRVTKTHLRVEAYGTVDELNAVLGTVRAAKPHDQVNALIEKVQRQLFHLGADLATPVDTKADWVVRMDPETVAWVEGSIDRLTADLPELKHFILPGGTAAAVTRGRYKLVDDSRNQHANQNRQQNQDNVHLSASPKTSITVSRSLSPRPLMLIRITSSWLI